MADIENVIKALKDGLDFKIYDNTCVLLQVCDVYNALELLKEQQAEIKRLKAEKTKAFDYLFSKFAGHSNYHGDSILCAIEAVKEGKKIKTVKTMDTDGEHG